MVRLVGPHRSGHEAGSVLFPDYGVGGRTGQPGCGQVQLWHQLLQVVVGLGDAGAVEGVGLDDVSAGPQVVQMDLLDDVGASQGEQIVVALQRAGMIPEAGTAEVVFPQLVALDHRSHCPIEHQDALF